MNFLFKRGLSLFIVGAFFLNMVVPLSIAQTVFNLPTPGTAVTFSPPFTPPLVRGVTLYPDNPLKFDFIVDAGDDKLAGEAFQKESMKLIKYFLVSLTVPENDMWVNLSPYEKNRIIPEHFGKTEIGRDLLSQDYILKQLTAGLMNPDEKVGAEFWNRVYRAAKEKFGTTDVPTDAFNKVWIVPDKAEVYVKGQSVFVVESHLKVMMEEDYLDKKMEDRKEKMEKDRTGNPSSNFYLLSSILKEIILPEIEKEVNEGKNFALLRQIQNSAILAAWYKKNLKETLLGKVYIDQKKTEGVVSNDKDAAQRIYNQYLEAFKKGAYDFIKEDYDPTTQEIIPRKYFSGGILNVQPVDAAMTVSPEQLAALQRNVSNVTLQLENASQPSNAAMLGEWGRIKQNYLKAFAEVSTEDELKRIARKMAKDVFPRAGLNDPDFKIKSDLFIELTDVLNLRAQNISGSNIFGGNKIEETVAKGRSPEQAAEDILRELREKFAIINEWIHQSWSIPEPYHDAQNEAIMGKPTQALTARAKTFAYSTPVAEAINILTPALLSLSVDDITELIGISSKSAFVNLFNQKAGGAQALMVRSAINEETLWQLRLTLEKIKKVKKFLGGEIVFIRDGDSIERTVILEPVTDSHKKIKALTIDAPFQFLAATAINKERYRYLEFSFEDVLDLDFDLENEPHQEENPINIGDVFSVDFKGKPLIVTVVGEIMSRYNMVNLTRWHDKSLGGHGFSWGVYEMPDALKEGRIKKLDPNVMGRQAYAEAVQNYIDQANTHLSSIGQKIEASTIIETVEPTGRGSKKGLHLIFVDGHKEALVTEAEWIRSERQYIWEKDRQALVVPFHVTEKSPVNLAVKILGVLPQVVVTDNDQLMSPEDIESVVFAPDKKSVEIVFFANGSGVWKGGQKTRIVIRVQETISNESTQLPQIANGQLLITKEVLSSDAAMTGDGEILVDPDTGRIRYQGEDSQTHPAVKPTFELRGVRHGETFWNEQKMSARLADDELSGIDTLQGISEGETEHLNDLTDKGIEQAKQAADTLFDQLKKELGKNLNKWRELVIITSTKKRAQDTANIFIKTVKQKTEDFESNSTRQGVVLQLMIDKRVDEIEPGKWQNLSPEEKQEFQAAMKKSADLDARAKTSTGESYLDLLNRSKELLLDMNQLYSGKKVIMFGHKRQLTAVKNILGYRDMLDQTGQVDWLNYNLFNAEPMLLYAESAMMKNIPSDPAMISKNLGGIDLNANEKMLEEQGNKMQLPLPANPSAWQDFQTNGFIPVIINITPPVSLPALLGAAVSGSSSELVTVSSLN